MYKRDILKKSYLNEGFPPPKDTYPKFGIAMRVTFE